MTVKEYIDDTIINGGGFDFTAAIISLPNNRITSLHGIEIFTNAKKLYIHNNLLTDLKGIEKLEKLETINCCNNLITNLDGIEKLYDLTHIDCSYNSISSLKQFIGLNNLFEICISDNGLPKEIRDYNINEIKSYYKNIERKRKIKKIKTSWN